MPVRVEVGERRPLARDDGGPSRRLDDDGGRESGGKPGRESVRDR
jgi:hypothetical protein